MEKDSKNTALKALQGHVWREAYKTGKIHGKVFDDVIPAFNNMTGAGKQIYIYSSGSVDAQKLLFGYTEHGDLSESLSGYFDTTTGPKSEKESYVKIAENTGVGANEFAFVTDISSDAKAAADAGMKAILVEREGNAPLSEEDKANFETISSFSDLISSTEVPSKRTELENEESNGVTEADGAEEEETVQGEEEEEPRN